MLNPNPALHAAREAPCKAEAQELLNLTLAAWSSALPKPHSSTSLSQEQADVAEPAGCTPKPAYRESTWQAEGMLFSVHKQEKAPGT